MRKCTVLFSFLLTLVCYGQNLSKVQKINGIEVYVLSEPLSEYEVVYGKGNTIKWSSFLTGGLLNESISTKITSFVNSIKKQAEKDGIDIDAIIYTNGKKIVGVKFNGDGGSEERMAEVQSINGLPVYVMAEPITKYKVSSKEGPGMKWKSFLTVGLVNNSVEQDISKYVRKMYKDFEKGKVDALLYNSGKKAVGIKFSE